ncbi:chemotaxis protein CheW [Bremerella sp.]|uniref:chemotaxis protein CheW n=1 Tax=Bremerella sp. TaxID=2795602 RepID=UPI003919AC06
MSDEASQLDPCDREESTADDVWSRLRQSMEKLKSVRASRTDPELIARRRAENAKRLREKAFTVSPAEAPLELLAFRKGNQRYALPVSDVIEVESLDYFCPVPGTPSFICGVMHWRGNVLSLLDLGVLFGIPTAGIADVHSCLVVEAAGHQVAIVTLEVEEIIVTAKSGIKPAPNIPLDVPADWVVGVYDDVRLVLNLAAILQDPRMTEWRN